MTTFDNAPPLPDWVPEPRPCPILQIAARLRDDDLPTPPTIVRGEN